LGNRVRAALGTIVALAAVVAAASYAAPALANGIGDLYAAQAAGIAEIHVSSSSVVSTIKLDLTPSALAFAADGHTLYATTGTPRVARVDIGTLDVLAPIQVPAAAVAIAYPKGSDLLVAMTGEQQLAIVDTTGGSITRSAPLPGPSDLLAADRRDVRVVAAQRGKPWVAVVRPADGTVRTVAVEGQVAAVAVDRATNHALVATTSPNKVFRLSLDDLSVTWEAPLPGAPAGIVAMADRVVASGGNTVWSVAQSGATTWQTTTDPITAITASDEGKVLYAVVGSKIDAFTGSGGPSRQVAVVANTTSAALAAVPRVSSLGGAGGLSPTPGPTGDNAQAGKTPAPSGHASPHPTPGTPSTDTIADVQQIIDRNGSVPGAIGVALVVLLLSAFVMREIVRHLEA
jgi:hypothetical protein